MQQLIKCLTKLSLQAVRKWSKNHLSKWWSEGQTSAVRGTHMCNQQCLTWWEEALQVLLYKASNYNSWAYCRDLVPQQEGLLGKTCTPEVLLVTIFSTPSLEENLLILFLHRAEAKLKGKEAALSDMIQWGTANGAGHTVPDTDNFSVISGNAMQTRACRYCRNKVFFCAILWKRLLQIRNHYPF